MQSITYQFNARTTQLNPAWLAVFSLWLIADVEKSEKEEKHRMQISNRKIITPRPW